MTTDTTTTNGTVTHATETATHPPETATRRAQPAGPVDAEPVERQDPAHDDEGGGGGAASWWRQGVALLVLVVVVGGIWYYLAHRDHAPAAQQAGGPRGPMPVAVMTVEPRDVPLETTYLAQTEPSQTVPIRARVSGYLVDRNFEEGQRVDKDQVLFRIDPQPFQVALDQAKAALAASQAQLKQAQQQSDRYTELAKVQSAAASELEKAQADAGVAQADVNAQQAAIEQAQLNLDYATIKSPIAGTIGQRMQDVGSYINPSSADAMLATVRAVDPIYVRFSVSEQDILKWQRLEDSGAVNKVKVDDLTVTVILPDGRVFPQAGKINYVDVAVDPSTGTAVTRATVPNPNGALLPGQYVNVRIGGIDRVGAIAVPQSAVIQNPSGTSVWVMADDGTAQSRPVTAGEWSGQDWIIDKGLNAGDKVIVDHLMQLSQMPPGAKVQAATPATQPTTAPAQ